MAQMFRAFRATSSLFRLNRVPLRVHARIQRDGGAASVQGVRLKKAPITRKYMLGSAIGVLLMYTTFTKIVFAPLDELADEFEKEGGLPENETPEDLGGSVFIPFPGTMKQIPQGPFRGSDPEWQEYIKFNRDPALIKGVRAELAEITRRSVEEKVKGGKGARVLKYWLDIDYPQRPPPVFVHSGIEITDDFISWSTVPIAQDTVLRLQHALFPVSVAKASWRLVQVLFSLDPEEKARSIMRAHYNLPDPVEARKTYPALASSDKKVTEDKVAQARIAGGLGVTTQTGNHNHSTTQQIQEPTNKQSDHVRGKAPPTISDSASANKDNVNLTGSGQPERRTLSDILRVHKLLAPRCAQALFTFRFTTAVNWKQVKVIPRGCILVSGLVQVETPLDLIVLDVIGVWDPKTRAYDTNNTQMGVRKATRKRQTPIFR